ncbi:MULTISPECIES: 4-(cytidine 5'-diphospho)-2-C-methyl-D-erythritol kinase [Leptolyngbya]|uniref:4-(cytidine 5'-diphospho)-2-C-methyl-D-erythritol kinase n=1 Tax=Leptolyngbya TaxID=47251 RepID=UPI00168579F2|nr:4-(cytidine 5'-diphospho)-2-C-methyl-D-erythritol kinase [Leptolyngbya sp. FACHB-1624]MBD1854147.1 4-(cytidine 5'-diphospho)-2-C-methyl-D-erythritol kinase [Leptolyngbya sp. FACHB-1624]
MRSYSLVAPAKINLYLQIVGDRPDGFHELVMVLQSIELADLVTVRAIGTDQIRVHCDNPAVPVDQTNLAYRAAELMMQEFPEMAARFGGVEIDLQKRIPMGAGLAGGSSNAAAVLVGIDLMWNLGLTQWELQELSARLGSDIPFCISGGTALATGRGEQLAPLTSLDHLYVVLAKYRDLPVSTPWAYKTYRQKFGGTYPKSPSEIEAKKARSREMLNAIAHHDFKQIGQHLYNDLELVVLPEFEKIQQLRDQFAKFNPLGTMMSGSGSTVFALAESRSQAEEIRERMRSSIPDADLDLWVTKLSQCGVHLANS